MFRFEDPIYLYLLALIPVLALIRFISFRNQKKRLRKFGGLGSAHRDAGPSADGYEDQPREAGRH